MCNQKLIKSQILTHALQNQVTKIAVKPGAKKHIYLERKRVGFVKNNNESISQTIACIWTDFHRNSVRIRSFDQNTLGTVQ